MDTNSNAGREVWNLTEKREGERRRRRKTNLFPDRFNLHENFIKVLNYFGHWHNCRRVAKTSSFKRSSSLAKLFVNLKVVNFINFLVLGFKAIGYMVSFVVENVAF